MMLSSSTKSTTSSSCNASSSDEALLEVLFDATSSLSSSAAVHQDGGMSVSVVVPSNGTVVDSFRFRQGNALTNLTACLSRSTCYGLQIINAWKGSFQIKYDGQLLSSSAMLQFPYYMTSSSGGEQQPPISSSVNSSSSTSGVGGGEAIMVTSTDDLSSSSFDPYESNLTFVELVNTSSNASSPSTCLPQCHVENETLLEVIVYGGNYGDGTMAWSIQDENNNVDAVAQQPQQGNGSSSTGLIECQDDYGGSSSGASNSSSSVRCGTVNGVRIARACVPRTNHCRQFVMGHPHQVPSEGSSSSTGVDDSQQGDDTDGGNSNSADTEGEYEADNRWVGHYPPSYRVSVDTNVVAEGSCLTFVAADIDGGGPSMGGDCSQCAPNETLLEIFQYQSAVPLHYTLRDVQTDQVLMASSSDNNNSSVHHQVLRYDRRCIPASQCYDLAFVTDTSSSNATTSSNSSITTTLDDGVSTQVRVGGAYYANTVVRELPFKLLVGELCDHRYACQHDEYLVKIDISTSGDPFNNTQHVPGYYCAWSIFDIDDQEPSPPTAQSHLPKESTTYFSNGYPGGGQYLHYQCVPDYDADSTIKAKSNSTTIKSSSSSASTKSSSTSPPPPERMAFGMLKSVSQDDVTWSVERNGVILGCRSDAGVATSSSHSDNYLSDYILTPLDGTCQPSSHNLPSSQSAGGTSVNAVVGIVVGIVASVVLLAVAVFYVGAGDDEAEMQTTAAGGRRGGRRISSRSTGGTVCDNESACSDDEEEQCDP